MAAAKGRRLRSQRIICEIHFALYPYFLFAASRQLLEAIPSSRVPLCSTTRSPAPHAYHKATQALDQNNHSLLLHASCIRESRSAKDSASIPEIETLTRGGSEDQSRMGARLTGTRCHMQTFTRGSRWFPSQPPAAGLRFACATLLLTSLKLEAKKQRKTGEPVSQSCRTSTPANRVCV